jgi:F0F1-type ATP synthase beta subunit
MDYVDFIHENLELVDIELMRSISVAIKKYMTKNNITDEAIRFATPVKLNDNGQIVDIAGNVIECDEESEDEESEEEEQSKKHSITINKKDGKTKITINI